MEAIVALVGVVSAAWACVVLVDLFLGAAR